MHLPAMDRRESLISKKTEEATIIGVSHAAALHLLEEPHLINEHLALEKQRKGTRQLQDSK